MNTKYVCLLRCKQGSIAHCPLRDQADPGKGVADVTQEGILLRKYYAIEAPLQTHNLSAPKLSEPNSWSSLQPHCPIDQAHQNPAKLAQLKVA